jgi:hydroxypyruvate isomerase
MNPSMNRRSMLKAAAAAPLTGLLNQARGQTDGRIKQSVCRWCYDKMSLDDLCKNAVRMGLKGIDLLNHQDWPTVQKYGLVPSMTPGTVSIPVGFNRKENHEKLIRETRENIERAAAAKAPNVIVMSGNRRGMPDEEAKENCAIGLRQLTPMAEDKGVTLCLELLNSKVDHKDYQCDHTAWGVDVMKRINSPRMKLLYDIYHMQIMEGDIIRTIRENIQYIGHFHTGGVPGRHELDDTQELNWRTVAKAIADLNYQGYMAHEFIPTRDPMQSLEEAVKLCTV